MGRRRRTRTEVEVSFERIKLIKADRACRYLRDQPLLHPSVTDEYLVMWYFEDWLKKFFYSVLQVLEVRRCDFLRLPHLTNIFLQTYSLDPLPYVRTQALGFIATLLREKPEQEQNLLRLLVNKLVCQSL